MNQRAGSSNGAAGVARPYLWTVFAAATALPFLILLCTTLWRMPFPLSEAVALFEDVAQRPPSSFLTPSSSYYRPLFHLTLSALWRNAASIETTLNSIRLLHIVPLTLLVLLFVWHLRPRTALEGAAATVAAAVLIGAPGLLGNLELPLSYTIVGMPAALIAWMLLERDWRPWHGPAIVAVTLVAIGFKEQGLVIVPLVIAGWWAGARGAGRPTIATLTVIAAAYVVFRLAQNGSSFPQFEQDIGLGFGALSSEQAAERFGAFPLWIYAYNGLSTIGNVLFAEPTDGVFRIARALAAGHPEPWHLVYLLSSVSLTGVIFWWGAGTLRRGPDARWSSESRAFIGLLVVLAASGALSFNYSRDRLGGMAVPFYALAAYFALRAAAARVARASRPVAAVAALALMLIAGAWQLRAIYTVEFTRQRAVNTHREWLTDISRRRIDFAGRPVYLRIMERMIGQGTAASAVKPTRYPRWLVRLLGEY